MSAYYHEDLDDHDDSSNNSVASTDDDDDDLHSKRQAAKLRRQEYDLYGSFLEDEEVTSRKRPKVTSTKKSAPLFVQGATQTNADASGENETSTAGPSDENSPSYATKETSLEPTAEELEIQKLREKANQHFWSLLQTARSSKKTTVNRDDIKTTESKETSATHRTTSLRFKPNNYLGAWEKHTKGIGGKLLAKMGFAGGALGKRGTEKNTPITVKVRPSQLGLGFGNFKEATALRKKQEEKVAEPSETGTVASSSVLPKTQDLLKDATWRRDEAKLKKRKIDIIPYTELLQKGLQTSILDLRGPQVSSDDQTPVQPPLAEELLHNVSLLLNTYENRLYSDSHFHKTSQNKLQSLQSELNDLKQQDKLLQNRIEKLRLMEQLLQKAEEITETRTSTNTQIEQMQTLIQQMGAIFTPDERTELKFYQVLVPTLLENVVKTTLDKWDTLSWTQSDSEELLRTVLQFASFGESDEDAINIKKSIFRKSILPKVKASLESKQWNPMVDVSVAIRLFETLCKVAKEVFPNKSPLQLEESEDQVFPTIDLDAGPSFPDFLKQEIISKVVYPKLANYINEWKPQLDSKGGLQNPLDSWILPWVPHLHDRSILPILIGDCKRKIRSAISFLHKSMSDDMKFFALSLKTTQPWRGALKNESLQNITSSYVTPRFARHLSKLKISQDSQEQRWQIIDMFLEYKNLDLVSTLEFFGILEGEVLLRLASKCHEWLTEEAIPIPIIAHVYNAWRTRIVGGADIKNLSVAQTLARNDDMVCRMFYSILLMLQASFESNADAIDELYPSTSNYKIVIARRATEERRSANEELLRSENAGDAGIEARIRLQRNGNTPTFRDVVEEFARERDILFQPRMGNNATKDGKQIFLFGKLPIYLDKNVVFGLTDGKWTPLSLEFLANMERR